MVSGQMRMRTGFRASLWGRHIGLLCLLSWVVASAADWPQWRYDAGRTAHSPEVLPAKLQLHWSRSFPQRVPVWDDPLNHDLMTYDRILEPIVAGELMFVGFNDSDKVVAFDIGTGEERWRYYTDGPVRFPAVAWKEKVFFVSDDGYLYCLNAEDGDLAWRFRGAPGDRKIIGNERVISAWPARGGPVIRDDVLYFAASIWPFMGTFIYALDAESGAVEWVNDGTSAQYIKQPHNAPSFAGVAPQGSFVATQEQLIVPGGRSVPAVFDRATGDFKYFHLAAGGKGNGGSFVVANEQNFFAHTRQRGVRAYELGTGDQTSFLINEPVLDGEYVYGASDVTLRESRREEALSRETSAKKAKSKGETALKKLTESKDVPDTPEAVAEREKKIANAQKKIVDADKELAELEPILATVEAEWRNGWDGQLIQGFDGQRNLLWEIEGDATGDLIKAGNHLYGAGGTALSAFTLGPNGEAPTLAWSLPVDETVQRLLAANGMLFAVTLEGSILAFGAADTAPSNPVEVTDAAAEPIDAGSWPLFDSMTQLLETKTGYALVYGAEDRRAVDILLEETDFHILVVESDADRVDELRLNYDLMHSVYGQRVVVLEGDPVTFNASPYFASLVVIGSELADRIADEDFLESAYASVRPYGGELWIGGAAEKVANLEAQILTADLEQVETDVVSLTRNRSRANASTTLDSILRVTRAGALPGAADWTHQYGNIANTVKSDDHRVKLPLGLLWFGGSSNMDVLPRHGHGPPEQVVAGRTIIEGMDNISARDVYTGRVIWKREIHNLDTYGIYFNESYEDTPLSTEYNQVHIPGANGRGTNYIATEDKVYVALEDYCEVLDAKTGQTVNHVRLPLKGGGAIRPRWGYIGVYEDVLLGGHDFAHFSKRAGQKWEKGYAPIEDLSASDGLLAFDRHSGDLLWRAESRHSFIHNGIVAGNGRVYCLDKLPKSAEGKLSRRGKAKPKTYRVVAFDAQTGKELWQAKGDIFGTWLSYSEEHDILLLAGAKASDRLTDEVGAGMTAYRGQTGEIVWQDLERAYTGPCILHHDLILTAANSYSDSAGAFSLLDGSPHLIVNPLTGKEEPWLFTRAYGCNTAVASEHMMTFRSGAAGFYDLAGRSGTGNLGGFRSSCTSNLVIANGVLNAPDYTRTCTCGYQNQTSLALIHMPDVEMWTYSKLGSRAEDRGYVKQVGINWGAPGDRLADDGTLWLEYPSVGGDSPELEIEMVGEKLTYFRHHSSRFGGAGLSWVEASGVEGVETITLSPSLKREESTTDTADTTDTVATEAESVPTEEEPAAETRYYTIKLHFSEPNRLAVGDRSFNIRLQGQEVLTGLDIVREAGGYRRSLTKSFPAIRVDDKLEIQFSRTSEKSAAPILSGLELIAE